MYRRLLTVVSLTVFLALPASAQRGSQRPPTTDLTVKVTYENGRPVTGQVRVQLVTVSTVPVTETFTRGEGEARFMGVDFGSYRLKITGMDIEEKISESFNINPREVSHMEFVSVSRKAGTETSREGSISAAQLNIPDKAESEYEKGIKAMRKSDLDAAEKHFERAAEYYPQYAAAINHLGVIAMQRGNPVAGQAFFLQAVKADDQYAPSYLNLAKTRIQEKNYAEASKLLTKATAIEPSNVEMLALLTMLDYESNQLPSAIAHARKVHSMPDHHRYAFAHYIAGKALETQSHNQEALAEYKLFVKESPQSATTVKAQASIDALERQRK